MSLLLRQPWLRAVPAVVYAGLVFYGGTAQAPLLPPTPVLSSDKVLHGLAFAGLEGLFELWGLELQAKARRVAAVCASIALGGLLELVQLALPYRSADWFDWMADAIGAVFGALFITLLARTALARGLGAWLWH
ncbi:MAG TPA: VanZ family protein [Polyangiaceae bacterium]|nr:VanZ family protein [Polyangiaceae bacterium]